MTTKPCGQFRPNSDRPAGCICGHDKSAHPVFSYDHDYKPGAWGCCKRCGDEKHANAGVLTR